MNTQDDHIASGAVAHDNVDNTMGLILNMEQVAIGAVSDDLKPYLLVIIVLIGIICAARSLHVLWVKRIA